MQDSFNSVATINTPRLQTPARIKRSPTFSRRSQLLLIVVATVVIASVVSHLTVKWLGIKSTHSGYHYYGSTSLPTNTILHGSSLAYDGLNWDAIAAVLGSGIESWATPGSSPTEWEVQHKRAPRAKYACVVISAYDLNEYILCDFRADLVPFVRSVGDLRNSRADWQFTKRVLSQYPLNLTRMLFPTAGRSDGVMAGFRDKLAAAAGRKKEVLDGPVFDLRGKSEVKERLSDWSSSRLQRRIVLTRSACQGKHIFHGPKERALKRLVGRASSQGKVLVIVVPVSPIYEKEFLSADTKEAFENALIAFQRACPTARLLRLDALPSLRKDEVYSDLVHLNMYGQQIATEALSADFKQLSRNQ